MGAELMGATFSNPMGHVEDMPIVRLHDKIFEANGTDWCYSDNGPLIKPNWLSNYIERYVAEKQHKHSLAGVKDPRAVFFLKDWQVAGQSAMRYVFVYRHWSTAVNSILTRASRHIINNAEPLKKNRKNLYFWQQPELAFDMWEAANRRMLDFYEMHPDKCVLFAQDAYASDNQSVQATAEKIGLPAAALSNDSFRKGLLTESVDECVIALIDDEKRALMEDTWQRLQSMADVAASNVPSISPVDAPALAVFNRFQPTIDEKAHPERKSAFDLSKLGWSEALGFLVRIPSKHAHRHVFEQLFYRPFTDPQRYETLAKIAHKQTLYLFTKLAKMRAMHMDCGHFDVNRWSLFAQPGSGWIESRDGELEQANPFSTRDEAELGELLADFNLPAEKVNLAWNETLAYASNLGKPARRRFLEALLVYREIDDAQQFRQISRLAKDANSRSLEEFALLKAMRRQYDAESVMELGDFYRRQSLLIKALYCYEEANRLKQDIPAIIARMAEARIMLSDHNAATPLVDWLSQHAPQNPVAKRCIALMNQSEVTHKPSQQPKHKQAFLRPVNDYKTVVDLQSVDPIRGEALDLYNRRINFVLKDNHQWLSEGIRDLSQAAAKSLINKIMDQWHKLWHPRITNSVLGIDDTGLDNQAFSSVLSTAQKTCTALSVDVSCLQGLIQILLLLEDSSSFDAMYLRCSGDIQSALLPITESIEQVHCVDSDAVDDELQRFDRVCYLHTDGCDDADTAGVALSQYLSLIERDGFAEVKRLLDSDKQLAVVMAARIQSHKGSKNMFWYCPSKIIDLPKDISNYSEAAELTDVLEQANVSHEVTFPFGAP